jgi:hypothetical protein
MPANDNISFITGTPERIDSPTKFAVYSNMAEVLLGGWDIRINFMEIVPPKDGKGIATVHGSVVMSPAHAKAFLSGLKQTIDMYEEKFGEIDLQRVLDAQKELLPDTTSQPQ